MSGLREPARRRASHGAMVGAARSPGGKSSGDWGAWPDCGRDSSSGSSGAAPLWRQSGRGLA
eukprot:9479217-Alexandrium_andersonii.AAC.1